MKKCIPSKIQHSYLLNTFSQQTLDEYKMIKVPHQLSLETGYRNVFSLIDRSGVMNGNSATHGVEARLWLAGEWIGR